MSDVTNLGKTGGERRSLAAILVLAGFLGSVLVNTAWLSADDWRADMFLATLALVLVTTVGIGMAFNGRLAGVIIDNRNRMSLSKLQMLLWTVLVISSLATLSACRLRAGAAEPLLISIPSELLAAMGIAAASLVGTPMVLSLKASETPTDTDLARATVAARRQGGVLAATGKLHGRADPAQAQWMDLFRGDEVGNADVPDLSKIQQFGFTVLLTGVYTATLVQAFADPSHFQNINAVEPGVFPSALPKLSSTFVTLLGISHASYLVYKAAPHTQSGDPAGADRAA